MHRLRAYIAATRALYASIPNPPGYESPFAAGRFTLAQHRRAVALGFEQYKASWRPEPSAAAETDGDESSSSSAALSAADADAEDGAALRDAARDVARDGVAFAQETAREKVAEVREMDLDFRSVRNVLICVFPVVLARSFASKGSEGRWYTCITAASPSEGCFAS